MKKIITITLIFVVLSAGVFYWTYMQSFHDIKFTVDQPDVVVEIFKKSENNKKISTLNATESVVKLKNGDYYFVAKSKKTTDLKENFVVDDTTETIEIKPTYSNDYLARLLATEKNKILGVINGKYPTIINSYDILDGKLLNKGDWFVTIIKQKSEFRDFTDSYRVILHKENNTWVLVHYPEIVITKNNFPDVPVNVIDAANNLSDLYS